MRSQEDCACARLYAQVLPYDFCNYRRRKCRIKIAPMARRKDERRFIALPAIAYGTDTNGQDFREPVCTLDLSARGARVSNLRHSLKIGQEVTIEIRKHKLRFRVAWRGVAGTATAGQIGLHAIESLKKIPDLSDLFDGRYVDTWIEKGKSAVSPVEEKVV